MTSLYKNSLGKQAAPLPVFVNFHKAKAVPHARSVSKMYYFKVLRRVRALAAGVLCPQKTQSLL